MDIYRALVVSEEGKGNFVRDVKMLSLTDLPRDEVLVKVHYSSLNYKDALSASGNRGVTRRYPHVPGIDAAGVVERSNSEVLRPGDKVIVSGFDLGMNHAGGFAEYLTAPVEWIVPLPAGMSLRESMIWGTAGFTAAQCVGRLTQLGVHPDKGRVVVTGASGGVGSFAVAILAKLGFKVAAVTGKKADQFLLELGATEVLPREEFAQDNRKLLLQEKWAGGVDTVGGRFLETVIRECMYGAADLNLSVYPFILRGVTLAGIDSAQCPAADRTSLWQKMASEWALKGLADLATVITLDGLEKYITQILAGRVKGRIVVKMI